MVDSHRHLGKLKTLDTKEHKLIYIMFKNRGTNGNRSQNDTSFGRRI